LRETRGYGVSRVESKSAEAIQRRGDKKQGGTEKKRISGI